MKLWLATEQAVTAQYARNHDRRPGDLNGADLDQSRMDPPQHALRVLLDRV
jgi:hypothetical protein